MVPKPPFSDSFGGPCRLVDVDTVERPHWTPVTFSVFWTGSDNVGQYVYAGGLWAVPVSVLLFRAYGRKTENLLLLVAFQRFLQYFFHLCIITCRNLVQIFRCFVAALEIRKIFFELTLVLDELEALFLQRVFALISCHISNGNRRADLGSQIRWFRSVWLLSVAEWTLFWGRVFTLQ